MLCVFYVATFSAFKLGFIRLIESPIWVPLEYTMDAIFLVDLILKFFTPRRINKVMTYNHAKIVMDYI